MPYDERFTDNNNYEDHSDTYEHDFDHDDDGFASPFSRQYGVDDRSRYGAGLDMQTYIENHVKGRKKGSSSGWTGIFKAFSSSYLFRYTFIGLGFLFGYQILLAVIGVIISLFH